MAVDGGYGDGVAEAEGVEFIYGGVRHAGGVGLVHSQHHGLFRAQQHVCHVLIRRRDARADIRHEDDDVRRVYRYLRLFAHEKQNLAVGRRLYAAGIDNVELTPAPLALGIQPVARDAGGILHYAEPFAHELVEKHGLAHVGPADYGNKRF